VDSDDGSRCHAILLKGEIKHLLLWTLHFLKAYPRQKLLSALGAIDPQTFRKYMWLLFICAVADREPAVVSIQ
jgi:hypothetical protein